jgi:hypothetical protein
LNGLPNFKLEQSSPTILGNNPAQKIVYTYSIVKNGVIAGTAVQQIIIMVYFPYFNV